MDSVKIVSIKLTYTVTNATPHFHSLISCLFLALLLEGRKRALEEHGIGWRGGGRMLSLVFGG